MIDRALREQARVYFLPYILGNCQNARRISRKIYRTYGIASYICTEKRRLLDCLELSCRFLPISPTSSSRLLAEQLIDTVKSERYVLPMLIAADTKGEQLIKEQRELLEAYFVITDEQEFFDDAVISRAIKQGAANK